LELEGCLNVDILVEGINGLSVSPPVYNHKNTTRTLKTPPKPLRQLNFHQNFIFSPFSTRSPDIQNGKHHFFQRISALAMAITSSQTQSDKKSQQNSISIMYEANRKEFFHKK
jgi:hypothetical protein